MATADKFKRSLPPDADRDAIMAKLMSRTDKQENGCWLWTGCKSDFGYGQITIKGQRWIVTRLMCVLRHGEIPLKRYVCHTCDQPACLNPEHLFIGTMSDNIQDCLKKGRNHHKRTTHCPRGHELAGDNVEWRPTAYGGTARHCRTCDKAKYRRKRGWPEHLWYIESVPNGYMMDRTTWTVVPGKGKYGLTPSGGEQRG